MHSETKGSSPLCSEAASWRSELTLGRDALRSHEQRLSMRGEGWDAGRAIPELFRSSPCSRLAID